MKQTTNNWQKSVSTASVSLTISLESSKTEKPKAIAKSHDLPILTNDEFKHRRYSFDDNGGGYMGL